MPDKSSLLSAINKAEQNAYGSGNNGELASIRARSIEDYLGEPYGDEVEGQSQVVSRDVFDTIESIKPSIIRIFTGGDEVCKFEPVGPEDEEQAKQESDYINYLIQEKNDWFQVFYDWTTDALLTKNAYALAYFDQSVDVETEKYQGLTEEELVMLLNDPEVEPVAHSSQPVEGGTIHDIWVKRTKKKGQIKICVLPPERCNVDQDTPSFTLRFANYFEYWDEKTLSEIREMGLEFDPEVKASSETNRDTPEDEARDQFGETGGDDAVDPSMAKYKVRMVWIRHDYNEDQLAELNFCIVIGSEVLHVEECSNIPVACIVPTPLPHRHIGLSIRDAVTDLQRINTTLWRQVLNNLYLANNGRYGISDKVNLDDMLVSRAGGVVRVNGVPSSEIFPFQHPVVAQHGIAMMEWIEQKRENRTGTNRYFTGTDQNAVNKTASGIAQLTSAASQRVEMIARVIAEGVKELFRVVHELTIKHAEATRQDKVRLRNKWVPVDPSTWKKRSDLKIAVGLGTGNKEVMGNNLNAILAHQQAALQIGATTPKKIYNALSEITKNFGFPNPDAFWEAPPDGPLPPRPDPKMAQVEMNAKAKQAEMQIEAQQEQQRMAQEQQMAQFDAMLKDRLAQADAVREAEFQNWKAALDAQTKVIVAQITAGATVSSAQIQGGDTASKV
jgi:hypothetical protein